VFIHDDVWLDDYYLGDRVIGGLDAFDIIGVAGNRRRLPKQPGWSITDTRLTWEDRSNVSGAVAHGPGPFGAISHFGAVPAQCEILDGVLLAARRSKLVQHAIVFDTRFGFHFYDLDFCRAARKSGLRLGTWPICITHQSKGAFGTDEWHEAYRVYIAKWGD
jgi:GT2 family glycosyltransferase